MRKAKQFSSKILILSSVLISCLYMSHPYAQTELDSLIEAFDSATDPETKYKTQTSIAYYYYKNNSLDTALNKYMLAAQMVPNDDPVAKGDAIKRIGNCYQEMEDLKNSLKYFKLAHSVYVQANADPAEIADILKDIGRVFYGNAMYDSAMVYYMQSKEIFEKNNIQDESYGGLLHYIGSVFKRQDNYDKACEYYQMEIDYGLKHGFKKVYAEGFYLSASCLETDRERVNHDIKAMHIYEELEREEMVGLMMGNIALGYESLGMLDSSYWYHLESIKIYKKGNSKSHLANEYSSTASVLIKLGRYDEAVEYLAEAEALALTSDLKKFIRLREIYNEMYEVNHLLGNYESAIEFLKLSYSYRDSARDSDHLNAIHEMELAYETEKKESEIAFLQADSELKKREAQLAEEETQRQGMIANIAIGGGAIILILGIFTFIKLKESQKQKKIILEQKEEVEFQKVLVDEKNKDIMDSMVYASTIQRAIITTEEYIGTMFPEFFVLYKPRDIVSGDFYWAYQAEDNKKLIAVGDCTGHGVPGAMMSMLGTAFLNEIVIEGNERFPNAIMERLRTLVKRAMKNKGAKDGMDMSFCLIEGNKLTFCGANLPLYIIRSGELIELKGNKQPVGFHAAEEAPFENRTFELEKGDHVYLFSDGYADQFGGPKGKKFKYKTLRDRLLEICSNSMVDQQKIIDEDFETWKGDLEQLDDVCVIGIQI